MTKSKKMLALVIALVVMLVAVSGTLIAVLVAGNQNAQSKVHVKYTSSDVNVKVEAKYYVGSTGTDMVDKSNSNAKSIELDANKSTGSLDQPSNDAVELSKTNNKIIYEYKFTNLSTTIPATIGQLVEDGSVVVPKDSNNNVKLTYTSSSTSLGSGATSDATTLNTQGLPASSTRYVYVIVSIVELLNDVDFEGTFGWDLAKGTTASLDTTGSGNSIVNVNTSQTGFYNAAALQNIDLMIGVENQEPDIYPMIAHKCFTGWYTDADLQTKAVFPMVVTADTKLYPKHETATSDLEFVYSESGYTVGNGGSAYKGSAKNIVIPDVYDDGTNGVAKVYNIGDNAFNGGSAIESIYFPASANIGGWWLFGSTPLKTITIASGNPNYKSDGNCIIQKRNNVVVAGCNSSIIPDYVTEIDFCAFYRSGITNIVIPSSVTTIGNAAFMECTELVSVTLNNGLKTIDGSFSGCNSLKSINIPDSVTSIGSSTFADCSALTSVTIGSGVKKINSSAFSGCANLTSAIFKNVTGWTVTSSSSATTGDAVSISSSDYSANATLLKTTYAEKYWNRA